MLFTALLGIAWLRRPSLLSGSGIAVAGETPVPEPRARWRLGAQALGFALALTGVAAFLRTGDPILFWWWTLVLLAAAALVFLLGEAPTFPLRQRGADARLSCGPCRRCVSSSPS